MNDRSFPSEPLPPLAGLLFGPDAAADDHVLARTPTEERTAAALRAQATVLDAALAAVGITAGARVAALLPSTLDAVAVPFAVWRRRAVLVPVNPRLTPGEIEGLLDATGARVVLASPDDVERLAPILAGRPMLDRDGGAVIVSGERSPATVPDRADGAALILTTSGTTGTPKPVVLAHDAILDGIDTVLHTLTGGKPIDHSRSRRPNVIPVPLALWAGIYNTLFALRSGSSVVLIDPFRTTTFAEVVQRFGITSSVLAPAMIAMLSDDPVLEDLAPLRLVRSITAPLSPLQARRFHERFGVTVLNSYGQTELGGEVIGWSASDARTHGETKLGAIGRPHRGIDLVVLDGDHPVAPGEEGELCIRSPFMMAGYLDLGLGDRLTPDGFLRTGDIGHVDDDGFVWLSGRVSDLIIRGGLKVFPAEVEEVLRLHPRIADVAVVGVPDERLGEVPWAFVVAREEPAAGAGSSAIDAGELDALARAHLVPYKVPARVEQIDRLPRNDVGKVLRRELLVHAQTAGASGPSADGAR